MLFAAALFLAVAGAVAALLFGKQFVSPAMLVSDDGALFQKIVFMLRAPRALGALLIGGSLAVSGLMLQSYFRNPLADPYILGVSSGAALGAVIKIIFIPDAAVPVAFFALAGGGIVVAGAWFLSHGVRGDLTITLLLSGVALSILAGSLLSIIILWARPGELGLIIRWLMGTLAGIGWRETAWLAAGAAVGLSFAVRFRREMNAFQLGATVAESIGVNVKSVQYWIVGGATLLAAVTVAAAGLIGFIGLIVPHICRIIAGGDVKRLIPLAAVTGAAVMIWCDTIARTVLASGELPVGAVTAVVGVPFFLWLMHRGRFLS